MYFFILASFAISFAFPAAWNSANDPFTIDRDFRIYLDQLPSRGELKDKRLAWPGNHWSNYLGGIAHRWSSANPQNFSYRLHSLNELKKLPTWKLDELSPAEKFDIFNSRYDYPTVKKLFARLSPHENQWHGICHGYAPASLNHPEPDRLILKNKDGLKLTFYSSDVAGLMSYYYAKVILTPVRLIGRRCNYTQNSEIPASSSSACQDLNAGSFHIVLTNKLGRLGESFIADIDRYHEVWNHLAVEYFSNIRAELEPDKYSPEGTVKRVQVETVVTYASAIAPKFDPVIGTSNAEYQQNTYEYYLDLDDQNRIMGGSWIGETRPDFVWVQKKATFTGEWAALKTIYRPVKAGLGPISIPPPK